MVSDSPCGWDSFPVRFKIHFVKPLKALLFLIVHREYFSILPFIAVLFNLLFDVN